MESSNRCVLYVKMVSSRPSDRPASKGLAGLSIAAMGGAAFTWSVAAKIIVAIARIVIAYLVIVIPPSKGNVETVFFGANGPLLTNDAHRKMWCVWRDSHKI
jgi:hypothetical protein